MIVCFKCDVCILNCSLIKPKRFLGVLFVFGIDFCRSYFEKLNDWQFHDSFREWMQSHPSHVMKWGNFYFFTKLGREFCDSAVTTLQLRLDPWNQPHAFAQFASNLRVTDSRNERIVSFWRAWNDSFLKTLFFLFLASPSS